MAVTIRDVAAAAGVSRAPRCPARCPSPELVSRRRPAPGCRRPPRELGYRAQPGGPRPDHRAHRQPRADRARPGQPALRGGGQGRPGRARGRRTTRCSSPTPTRTPTAEPGLLRALAKQVDGIVLVLAARSGRRAGRGLARSTPVVLMNRRVRAASPAVTVDNADGMRQAVEHLPRSATGGSPTSPARGRRGPTASASAGCAPPPRPAGTSTWSTSATSRPSSTAGWPRPTSRWRRRRHRGRRLQRPRRARPARAGCGARGVAVPGRISVLGCDDIPMSAMTAPGADHRRASRSTRPAGPPSTCCSRCAARPAPPPSATSPPGRARDRGVHRIVRASPGRARA